MREKDEYRDFPDQEINDLESEYILTATAHEYGVTLDEAARLYYKPGMTGQQLHDALKAHREKLVPDPKAKGQVIARCLAIRGTQKMVGGLGRVPASAKSVK
jgi:hypothetical protein